MQLYFATHLNTTYRVQFYSGNTSVSHNSVKFRFILQSLIIFIHVVNEDMHMGLLQTAAKEDTYMPLSDATLLGNAVHRYFLAAGNVINCCSGFQYRL